MTDWRHRGVMSSFSCVRWKSLLATIGGWGILIYSLTGISQWFELQYFIYPLTLRLVSFVGVVKRLRPRPV